jgi:hypothetical protein
LVSVPFVVDELLRGRKEKRKKEKEERRKGEGRKGEREEFLKNGNG